MKIISLQKPYGLTPRGIAVDVNEANEFKWSVSGDLQTHISIEVYDNSTLALVWSLPKTQTYANRYSFPTSGLLNGKEYKWNVTIYNEAGQSISSDYEVFQTSGRPVLNIPPIAEIGASTYNFSCEYTQSENVGISTWTAYLYNSNKILIAQSGIQTNPILEYLFSNLQSESTYFIEFQATSNKGLTGSSGLVQFNVLYTQPNISIYLEGENLPDVAGVRLNWNVVQIIFKADVNPPVFIDHQKIDLRNNRIYNTDGFSIDRNFTLRMWLESPTDEAELMKLKGSNGELSLYYSTKDYRFHLIKNISGYKTHWVSTPAHGNSFCVTIQQIDTHFNLYSEVIS